MRACLGVLAIIRNDTRSSIAFLPLLLPLLITSSPARAASYLQVPVVPSSYGVTASGFTFECWIKVVGEPGFDPRIVRCRNTHEGPCGDAGAAVWNLFVCQHSACSVGKPYFGMQPGSPCYEVGASASIVDGNYHHLAATYDGSTMRIYVDGLGAGSVAVTGSFVDVTGGLLVIGNSTAYNNGIDCEIDDIRLWSVARTQLEIQASMGGETATGPNLVANWKLNGDGADAMGGPPLVAGGDVTYIAGKYGSAAFIDNTPPPPVAPVATATDNSDAGVTVAWNDVPKEDGYRIYRNATLLGINVPNDTTFFDAPAPGTYAYCVEAYNAAGTSARGCDSGTRLTPPPPDAPSACTASDDQMSVVISWPDVANEDGYHVYRDGTLIASPGRNTASCTDTPTPGFYNYCVEAYNYGGVSAQRCDEGTALPFAGHTYEVVFDPIATWHGADQAAGTSGKYLVTILSAGEEAFVQALIARSNPPIQGAFWIGYTRSSGTYAWGTGESSPYTHWAPNQPDNSRGNEAYASTLFSTNSARNGFWNDAPDEGYGPGTDDIGRLGYIVETGPLTSVPPRPPSFIATDNSASIGLSWTDVSGETGYRIFRDGTLIATTGANSTETTYTPPIYGSFTFCIEAFNDLGPSDRQCDQGTSVPPPPPPPTAPAAGPVATAVTLGVLGLFGSRSLARRARRTTGPEPGPMEDRR